MESSIIQSATNLNFHEMTLGIYYRSEDSDYVNMIRLKDHFLCFDFSSMGVELFLMNPTISSTWKNTWHAL